MRKVILILMIVSIASLVIAQDNYINRDIRPNMSLENSRTYTLDFLNGLSFPQGDLNHFLKNGFNSGILFHKNFSKKLSLGFSANHSRFDYRQNFGPIQGSGSQELNTTSFDVGPQYNMRFGRFSVEFYGRSGLSLVNSPQSSRMFEETDITITTLEAYKSTALTVRLGANMTANIFEGLDFYFSSEYMTTLNSEMNYQTRDLSEAVREDGTLNSVLANELPYTNESLSLSMLNVNIGVRISIGANSNRHRSNSIYKANGNSMFDGYFLKSNSNKKDGEKRAQYNNLTRSKTSSIVVPINDNKKGKISDTIQTKGKSALDQNINRIDNTSIIAPKPDMSETQLNSEFKPEEEITLTDISEDKLKLKTKAQLSKERRKRKRIERRLKRLKSKM
ncbi:hypothetical protein [Ancylomarina sp. 16SWW S1-10-2]|uniref:hypothetical protein n=1 Tax=Ancylomarina sp. 16SWW S1-10-2 TaxID=2499681 RepID=UPI0012AE80DB|nr:hypothetical protein [Ancylomarina sp. 16SWW S1-10-2]MRT92972.1 hypothetical protein [Ancylomarina sp. 16SWW S1-10-2]